MNKALIIIWLSVFLFFFNCISFVHSCMRRYYYQGCESSSFQLISSFLKIFLCQNFSFFFYFQPIFGILPNFRLFFPFFFVCGLSHLCIILTGKWTDPLNINVVFFTNAAVNGHLELAHLKVRQRFDAISTSNLKVYKFRDWWILTCFIFGLGESSPDNIWSTVNLERTCILLFYYFFLFESESWLRKKNNQLGESSPFAVVNLDPIFWKRGELLVNPDLTILLKRWIEVKTWGG